MNRSMTKQQLKETLREMAVSYPPEASEDDLKQILQSENSRRWFQQGRRNRTLGHRTVLRRKGARQ